jgi:D-arabinose 1-dehydrogenase-like Zn-dependent alcohol dehydrogenase
MNRYLSIMAAGSTIYPLTVDFGKTPIPLLRLIVEGITIQGSATASHAQQVKMLQFCVDHNIRPTTMEWPMNTEGITTALKTLKEGKMRYRGVVVAQ